MSNIILVLATHNTGKVREFKLFFKDSHVTLKYLSEFRDIPPFKESGNTFEEIAVNKAKFVAECLEIPSIADDSGLAVECLNGSPGIFSARYAGKYADDSKRNRRLLSEMRGKDNRNASFICAIAIAKPDGKFLVYTGKCSGIILKEPLGVNGFGYDPLFYYPPLKRTFAQISPEEKTRISHRGIAMQKVKDDMNKIFNWLLE